MTFIYKTIKRQISLKLSLFLTITLLTTISNAAGIADLVKDFGSGKLDSIANNWQSVSETDKVSPVGIKIQDIVDKYSELSGEIQKARKESYNELVADMEKSLQKARWQDELLTISKKYDFDDEDKVKLETQLTDDSQEYWLETLQNLFAVHAFCERMDMTEDIDPDLKQSIIDKGLEIGNSLEEQGKGLDAYSKALAFVGELTNQPNKYDEMHDELQRKAIIEATYVPDPNSDSVTWEERRKEITMDIIEQALADMASNYVEEPDYKAMVLKGIEYCQMLAKTDNLEKTFTNLNDEDKKSVYSLKLKTLGRKMREIPKEDFNFNKCRQAINELLDINKASLEFPSNVMLAEFGEGMFDAVDTYTYIIWPQAVEDFRKTMTNVFSGIGVVIKKNEEGYIVADSLISYESPACIAGMDANDVIIAVDGKETKDMTTEKAIDLITGPDGTDVVLTVKRDGTDETKDYTVTRKRIIVPTVKGLTRDIMGDWVYFLDEEKTVGYLRITNFSGETALHLLQDMAKLKSEGMKAMVLDLRSNTGGYLNSAVDIVNFFVKEGKIVSVKYRMGEGGAEEDIKMARPSRNFDPDMPLVVLVNSVSASASEIVSGSLKDNGRALIIGTQTYGKGSVQNVQKLGFTTEAELKITIAKYYLPNGRCVMRDMKDKLNKDYGVEPDVKVELTADQIEAWAKAVRDADTLHRPDIPRADRHWDVWTVDEMLDVDPQLQTALLILKGQVVTKEQ